MSRNRKQAKKHRYSMSNLDKNFARVQLWFSILLTFDQTSPAKLKKLQEMWERRSKSKRRDELTEGKQKARAKEQGQLQRENEREQGWDNIRKFLQAGIDINIDNPVIESELLRTTKELLDIVDKAQAEPLLVSRTDQQKFYTGLDRCKKLYLKAKQKAPLGSAVKRKNVGRPKVKPAETERNTKEVKLQPKEPSKDTIGDQVFICYSRKDERWLDELQTHLKPCVRNGPITTWSDKKISTGSKWFSEIKTALASAKVGVLLVTKDFLASDFIHKHELKPLLKKAQKGKVEIIWIPVRSCLYKETPLKKYQAVCKPNKPLANMKKPDRDDAWVKICEKIKKAAQEK